MLNVIDSGTNWGWICVDDGRICFEDGSRKDLSTDSFVLAFWEKYKGKKLSEVSDVRDLKWLVTVADEKKNPFWASMFTMRLKELE